MTAPDICPMTGEPHLWGDWERVIEVDPELPTALSALDVPGTRKPTGDRARECRVCGRWDIEWATKWAKR